MDWAPGHMAAILAPGANLNSVLVAGLTHWMFPEDKMGLWWRVQSSAEWHCLKVTVVLMDLSQALKAWVWERVKPFWNGPRREKGVRRGG